MSRDSRPHFGEMITDNRNWAKTYPCKTKQTQLTAIYGLKQRCPTHSPLDTCGEWPFKCGEWLTFQKSQNWVVLNKIWDQIMNFQFKSHLSV